MIKEIDLSPWQTGFKRLEAPLNHKEEVGAPVSTAIEFLAGNR
ncbi:MAG: hypothetical protein ACKVON_00060 [Beijerinckiaceae bacterium]